MSVNVFHDREQKAKETQWDQGQVLEAVCCSNNRSKALT